MKKILMSVVALGLFVSCGFCDEVVDKTLAIVNGEPLMSSEFNKIIEPIIEQQKAVLPVAQQTEARFNEIKNKVLDEKISQMVLVQAAKKANIKIQKRELDASIAQIKSRFPNEAAFNDELKKEGISNVEFEKKIEEQMMSMKFVENEVKNKTKRPTEQEVKDFYNKVQKKMKGQKLGLSQEKEVAYETVARYMKRLSSEQVRLRQIFVKSADKVSKVKNELAAGKNFADVSAKYSDDQMLSQRKGDMGMICKGDLTKELETKAFALGVGQYTKEPVKTQFGYHFLKVEGKNAAQTLTFDDVKNDLAEVVYQQNAKDAYDTWLNNLRSKASIKINKVW